MAKQGAPVLDRTFAALADPTRRAILERLADADRLTVSDLAAPFAMSLPAVLKHVGVLAEAGLVAREKLGRVVYCRLETSPLRDALRWLALYDSLQAGRHEASSKPAGIADAKLPSSGKREARGRKPSSRQSTAKPSRKATASPTVMAPPAVAKKEAARPAAVASRRRPPTSGRGTRHRR